MADEHGAERPGLAGRGHERAAFERALNLARGGTPQVLVVEGGAGMGKSALLDEFAAGVSADENVIRATCDRFEVEVPFAIVGMLTGEWLDPLVSPVSVGRALLEWLGEQQPDGGVAVLLFDDVHWMDVASAAALRFALRRLRADRVLVVLARRPTDGVHPWSSLLADTRLATRLVLSPLTVADVASMVIAQGSRSPDVARAERLRDQSGGLPLLIKALIQGADLDGPRVRRRGPAARVPTVKATERLIQTLEPSSRRLLQALAVIAAPADVIDLGQVADVADPTAALTEALGTPVLTRLDDSHRVDFTHALFRDAVYDGIAPDQRREMHTRAADRTTGAVRLRHRVAAADRPDAALFDDLRTTARSHASNGEDGLAATSYLDARTVSPDAGERDRMLALAVFHHVRAGNLRDAVDLQPTLEGTTATSVRDLAMGILLRETGHPGPAREHLTTAVAAAQAAGEPIALGQAALELATLHMNLTNGPGVVEAAQHALRSDDDVQVGQARVMLAMGLWFVGRSPEASRQLDQLPAAITGTWIDATQYAVRGIMAFYANDYVLARRRLDAAVGMAHLWRPSVILDQVYLERFLMLYASGDWDAATIDAANALALAEAGERTWLLPLAHAAAAQVPAGRGRWDEADHHLARARHFLAATPSFQGAGSVADAAVTLAVARGAWDEVLPILAPMVTGESLAQLVLLGAYRAAIPLSVEAHCRLRHLDEARAGLADFENAIEANPGAGGPYHVEYLRGLLAQTCGDAAAARVHYAEGLQEPGLDGRPLAKARLLHAYGRLELASGSRRAAIDLLRAARALYLELRAAPFQQRCEEDLAACGLRMADTKENPLALTAREQDVATLIARGLTNAEAAGELFVTAKTVEYHLGNIYAKLGISSRRQLRTVFS